MTVTSLEALLLPLLLPLPLLLLLLLLPLLPLLLLLLLLAHLDGDVLRGGGEDLLVGDEGADPRGVRLEGVGVGVGVEVPHLS